MRPELMERVAALSDEAERERFFAAHPELRTPEVVVELCDAVVDRLRDDLGRAERLAEAAGRLAVDLADDYGQARALRARANVHLFRRQHRRALELSRAAIERLEGGGHALEAAITRSSAIQSLIHLGRYDEALEWIARARQRFVAEGDEMRQAVLDFNTGALLARQDRYQEALERFESAHRLFVRVEAPANVGISLRNIAVCLQDLNHLAEAEEAYRRARAYCADNDLPLLGLEVECNVAYLHFLRGEYGQAIRGFDRARRAAEKLGDGQHRALADLDQAEVLLELNLPEEAVALAREASAGFDRLGMAYEAAKALTFQALALGRRGPAGREEALELLLRARSRLEAESSRIWPWRIDLHRGLLLWEQGDLAAAAALASGALGRLREVPALAAVCRVLLARLELAGGDPAAALRRMDALLPELARHGLAKLEFQAHLLRGQALVAAGDAEAALAAFGAADGCLDALRGQLVTDELKIAYLEDKTAVYDGLVDLATGGPPAVRSPRDAFRFIEKAKSRGLADLLASGVQRLPAKTAVGGELVARLRRQREEVAWLQRRIDRAIGGDTATSPERLADLQAELRTKERQLVATVRQADLDDHEYGSLQSAAVVEPETLQRMLPEETTLVEYYVGGGRLQAAVVRREALEIVPLGDAARIEEMHRSFRLQLGKFVRGNSMPAEMREFAARSSAIRLRSLYDELIAPLEQHLDGGQLIVVPHGFLHWLPFHALTDGAAYLVDRFTVSYAPSATVLGLCAQRPAAAAGRPLVMGVADDRAPLIEREVRAVAGALPGSILRLGAEAGEAELRRHGERARFVHIATHGLFRGDHPMFSAIQLGDGRLSVVDLYGLSLGAELVVLSGCSTGLNVVRGGDEQVGLTRGLLYAGARSLIVTLWEVNDESTGLMMEALYERLAAGEAPAPALAGAMRRLRESYPEPYYWAPFMLTGWPFS